MQSGGAAEVAGPDGLNPVGRVVGRRWHDLQNALAKTVEPEMGERLQHRLALGEQGQEGFRVRKIDTQPRHRLARSQFFGIGLFVGINVSPHPREGF